MEIIGIIAAFLLVGIPGGLIGRFLDCTVRPPEKPESLSTAHWVGLIERDHSAGKWIGILERFLMVVAFWLAKYGIIAAWLAFKVAAKWEAWSQIVKVPEKPPATDVDGSGSTPVLSELTWYQVRRQYSGWLLSRFLIGTLLNILISGAAAYIGRHINIIIGWLHTATTTSG